MGSYLPVPGLCSRPLAGASGTRASAPRERGSLSEREQAVTAVERVLDRCERARSNGGDSYLASCPVPTHGQGRGDRNPSLSIAYTDGKVLLDCKGGCHVQDVVTALGLDWPDLWDKPITSERGDKVAEWTYVDRKGSPYHIVERWQGRDGKRFVQRVPGAERPGLPRGFKPCLYKMPKIDAAVKAGEEVYIVEGEKCVSAAEHLGLIATTAPGGCNGWRDYYAGWLRGCSRVTIVCDNDEPGMRYAATIAVCLRGAEIPVRTVKVALDDPKADLYDHVQAGLGVADLVPIKLNRLRPEGTSAHTLLTTNYPPVTWAIDGILPTGLALLGGPPKAAKSLVALDMALGVAAGGRAMSELTCRQGSVLYLSLDNDAERRLSARAKYLLAGMEPGELPIEFHVDFPVGDSAIKACQEWYDDERDDGHRPLLVVVDTLGKVEPNFEGGGQDNAYLASTHVLSRWSKFATDNDVAVLAVHHDRKSGDEDWLNRFTGSRGITATAQTLMMLEHKRGEPNGMLRIAGRDIETDDLELRRMGWSWVCIDRPTTGLTLVGNDG